MKNIHILGHDNTSLSVILEIIFQQYGSAAHVTIVSNLPEAENPQREFAFLHPEVATASVFHDQWEPSAHASLVLGSMGTNVRKQVYDFFNKDYKLDPEAFLNLVHPFTSIGQKVEMVHGVTVNPGVIVAPYTYLGRHVYLNRNSSIGHHSILEPFVSVNPGAIVNGKCRIGAYTTIGAGAVVNDGLTVGKNCIIGSGSVVTKDIPEGTIAFGSPAKPVKDNPRIFEA